MEEVESGGCMEKYAKDLEGFLGSCSLPRSNFFVPLCKDNRSPQLRVFPAWGSPQMAKLASKFTSHSTGCGGGGLSQLMGKTATLKRTPKSQDKPFSCQQHSGIGSGVNAPGVGVSQSVSFLPPPSVLSKRKRNTAQK